MIANPPIRMKERIVKRFVIPILMSFLLLTGGPAYAAICKKCQSLFRLPAKGTCSECNAATASKSLKLCPSCSKKNGRCENCGELLVSKAEAERQTALQAEKQAAEKQAKYKQGSPFLGALAMTAAQTEAFSKWQAGFSEPPGVEQTAQFMQEHLDPARLALFRVFAEYGMPTLDQVLSGPVLLDDAADGCTVQVNPGQFVVCNLPASGASQWQPTMLRGKGLITYTRQTFANPDPAPGEPDDIFVMILKVTSPGTALVQLRSDQPWNADEPVRQIGYTLDAEPTDRPLALLSMPSRVFKLHPDLKGKTQEQLTADPQPDPPTVDFTLRILNRSDQPFELMRGSDKEQIKIELTGPGAIDAPAYVKMSREIRQGKPFTLKPGKWLSLPIKRLSHGLRGVSQYAYWTRPGKYKLKVTYRGIQPGADKTFTLECLPVYLHVVE